MEHTLDTPTVKGLEGDRLKMSDEELRAMILYQAGAVKAMAEAAGGKMRHVKPHGALYNTAAKDHRISFVIARAVKDLDSSLILVGQSGSRGSANCRGPSPPGL